MPASRGPSPRRGQHLFFNERTALPGGPGHLLEDTRLCFPRDRTTTEKLGFHEGLRAEQALLLSPGHTRSLCQKTTTDMLVDKGGEVVPEDVSEQKGSYSGPCSKSRMDGWTRAPRRSAAETRTVAHSHTGSPLHAS